MKTTVLTVTALAITASAAYADCSYASDEFQRKITSYKANLELMVNYSQKLDVAKSVGDASSVNFYKSMGNTVAYEIAGSSPVVLQAAADLEKVGYCGWPPAKVDAVVATVHEMNDEAQKFIAANR